MQIWAGKITEDSEALKGTTFAQLDYFLLNFNSFPEALLTLFHLNVISNYHGTFRMKSDAYHRSHQYLTPCISHGVWLCCCQRQARMVVLHRLQPACRYSFIQVRTNLSTNAASAPTNIHITSLFSVMVAFILEAFQKRQHNEKKADPLLKRIRKIITKYAVAALNAIDLILI